MLIEPLFADAGECIAQFFSIGLFLLLMFGGMVVRFLNQQFQKNREKQRRHEAQFQGPPSNEGPRGRGRPDRPRVITADGIEIIDDDPRSAGYGEPEILTAEVVDDGPGVGSMQAYLHSHGYDTPELEQRYDSQLGTLGDSSDAVHESETAEPEPATVSPQSIASSLANPQDVRKALILGEILNPPTERWE